MLAEKPEAEIEECSSISSSIYSVTSGCVSDEETKTRYSGSIAESERSAVEKERQYLNASA